MGFKKLVNDTKIEKRRKIIAIYCRVSTDEQAEFGYSIDEQKRLLEEWCKANDYIIYKCYSDRGISGKNIKDRPALKELLSDGYIPSYCTACYRKGRTGDRFMQLAKSGNIKYVCEPNALMTLHEFTLDYGDKELYEKAQEVIKRETENIQRDDLKTYTKESMKKMKDGERDFYL